MKYMRNTKNITINGSTQKNQLLNMGYYHGYKGYKYIKTPTNQIAYSDFHQLLAIYNFDMSIKTILYPYLMQIETSFKSRALETCINLCSENFAEVYELLLDDYKKYSPTHKEYKNTLKLRLDLRNSIYTTISDRYKSNLRMVQHYHHQDKPVPLWTIFEIITLGQFGTFLMTMNEETRVKYSTNINLYYTSVDQGGRLPQEVIFLIKDLRNSVAHNSVVFDCRFMTSQASKRIKYFLEKESTLEYTKNVQFNTITDYLVLVICLMKKLKFPKMERNRTIKQFQSEVEKLRKAIPIDVFNSILGSDTKLKISKALET